MDDQSNRMPPWPRTLDLHDAERLAKRKASTQELRKLVMSEVLTGWGEHIREFGQLCLLLSNMHRGLQPLDLSSLSPEVIRLVVRMALATGMQLQIADAAATLRRAETDWNPTLPEYFDSLHAAMTKE